MMLSFVVPAIRIAGRVIAGFSLLLTLPFIGIFLAGWVVYAGIEDYKARRKMTDEEKSRDVRLV